MRLRGGSFRGRLVSGFATRSRSAGHASRSAQTRHALRLKPDRPIGAGQRLGGIADCFCAHEVEAQQRPHEDEERDKLILGLPESHHGIIL